MSSFSQISEHNPWDKKNIFQNVQLQTLRTENQGNLKARIAINITPSLLWVYCSVFKSYLGTWAGPNSAGQAFLHGCDTWA